MSSYKPYPAYKDSKLDWLGNVPEHWPIIKGKWEWKKESRPIREEDEIVTAFRDGQVTLRKNRREDGFTMASLEHGYQGIRKGDLVIHGMDAFAGAIGVSDSDGKSSPVYSACTPLKESNPRFFAYLLKEMSKKGWIEALAKGIRERSTEFKFPEFSNLQYPIPPKSEQTAIARFLDRKTAEIQKFIALKEKTIALLQERKTAIINQAVTKGLDPNVEMRDSGIEWLGMIPKHWEVKKLKYVAKVKGRIGFRGYTTSDLVTSTEGALTLGASHIDENGQMDISSPVYISWKKYFESPEIIVDKSDLLIVQRGSTCGKVGIISTEIGKATINPSLVILKNLRINPEYLFFILKSELVLKIISERTSNTAIPMLSQEQIGNFPIICTNDLEQKKIVDHIKKERKDIDELINISKHEIRLIKEYQQSLISEAVTGKIDVRDWEKSSKMYTASEVKLSLAAEESANYEKEV